MRFDPKYGLQKSVVIKWWKFSGEFGENLGAEPPNESFHLTKPLVTHLAGARSAPNDFAGEPNVIQI